MQTLLRLMLRRPPFVLASILRHTERQFLSSGSLSLTISPDRTSFVGSVGFLKLRPSVLNAFSGDFSAQTSLEAQGKHRGSTGESTGSRAIRFLLSGSILTPLNHLTVFFCLLPACSIYRADRLFRNKANDTDPSPRALHLDRQLPGFNSDNGRLPLRRAAAYIVGRVPDGGFVPEKNLRVLFFGPLRDPREQFGSARRRFSSRPACKPASQDAAL